MWTFNIGLRVIIAYFKYGFFLSVELENALMHHRYL